MAKFNLRRFASPDVLKTIQEESLRALLSRHGDYFTKRGIHLNGADPAGHGLDHEALAAVLVSPEEDIPPALVDALYMIHEMATEEGMQDLLEAVKGLPERDQPDLDGTSDLTPADVAVRVWLKAPDLLEKRHAEQFVGDKKSFEYYRSTDPPKGAFTSSRAAIQALEKDLGDWFASKKKGDVVRVFAYPKGDEVWFLVRHGDTFRREGALKAGESASVFYRPETHDVLVYNSSIGEMGINAGSKGEKEIYRRMLGRHLFAGDDHFPSTNHKYTLDPLRDDGEASLVCSDVGGIEWIQLTEVAYFWGGAQGEIEIRKAGDIFEALKTREMKIHQKARIIGARFRVKFSDSKTPRSVYIRPTNVAKFTRDDDGRLVEEWLGKRGFSKTRSTEPDEAVPAAVAGA